MPLELQADHLSCGRRTAGGLIRRTLDRSAVPCVCGTFRFSTRIAGTPKPVNHHWHGVNLKGVVDYHRNHKLAWQAVQEAYRGAAGR